MSRAGIPIISRPVPSRSLPGPVPVSSRSQIPARTLPGPVLVPSQSQISAFELDLPEARQMSVGHPAAIWPRQSGGYPVINQIFGRQSGGHTAENSANIHRIVRAGYPTPHYSFPHAKIHNFSHCSFLLNRTQRFFYGNLFQMNYGKNTIVEFSSTLTGFSSKSTIGKETVMMLAPSHRPTHPPPSPPFPSGVFALFSVLSLSLYLSISSLSIYLSISPLSLSLSLSNSLSL